MAIYKYLHPDRLDVLKSRRIRFTPAVDFNDPFELNPNHQFPYEPQRDLATTDEQYAALGVPPFEEYMQRELWKSAKSVQQHAYDGITADYGFLCLTRNQCSLLMWAHYADSHRGYILEFDESHPSFWELGKAEPIHYQNERPLLMIEDDLNLKAFFSKGLDWSYESEYRLVAPFSKCSFITIPPDKHIYFRPLPQHAVRSVILGCRMLPETRSVFLDALNDTYWQHVDVYDATIGTDTFEIEHKLVRQGNAEQLHPPEPAALSVSSGESSSPAR